MSSSNSRSKYQKKPSGPKATASVPTTAPKLAVPKAAASKPASPFASLTTGEVRGLAAQQEIRTVRQKGLQKTGVDPLDGLKPTNDLLHRAASSGGPAFPTVLSRTAVAPARTRPGPDFASAESLQNKYQVLLRGTEKRGEVIGKDSGLLTPGQVRGFEAQREIRELRKKSSGDPLEGLRPTNDSLHAYAEATLASTVKDARGTVLTGKAAEREKMGRIGAAMQGHGLVHTPNRPGEVLLGSRSSGEYKALADETTSLTRKSRAGTDMTAERGQARVANVVNWNINRNDAFMAGALLGHNTFSLPLTNAQSDYVSDKQKRGAPPGRVTIREMAQVNDLAPMPSGPVRKSDRYQVGQSKALSPMHTPGGLVQHLPAIGQPAQDKPIPHFNALPGVTQIPVSTGTGRRGGTSSGSTMPSLASTSQPTNTGFKRGGGGRGRGGRNGGGSSGF
ncbi:hypothetical protein N8I74_06715 [Chitiniphilus purpureus]|uniref:Uncharacterized protein n=1 Tax=Chitiniphilus purpureus TaxID=2981137 RepID=A0ABY6DXZ2_9NEIS|nr:hypothetical protein [Chitiniphilus sp. CD1]UXY16708.1 hypothetical protein N8I74_06715 [Chitiniphilus sp. CD1]